MRRVILAVLLLSATVAAISPLASAAEYQDVELRLNSELQYPNDRPITVLIQAMAFEDDKPSRSPVQIHAEIRWKNGTAVETQELSIMPGIQTIMIFSPIEQVGLYYVFATATVEGSIVNDMDQQATRITYAPQQYTAGFLDSGTFIVTPLYDEGSLTVSETMETGVGTIQGKTYTVGNKSMQIDVPEGYVAVRYNIIDENGWYNYERSDKSGLTIHGTPYSWIYGDLSRVEPVATFVSYGNIAIGALGGILIITGCSRFIQNWSDERRVRQKKLGIDGSPSFRERRQRDRMRREVESEYYRSSRDPYRRRYY